MKPNATLLILKCEKMSEMWEEEEILKKKI